MSAPDDLKPQVPGELATDGQEPPMSAPDDGMQRLADGTVAEIGEAIPALTDDELETLAVYEQHGKGRKGVLEAIEAELASRDSAPSPPPAPAAKKSQSIPAKFSRPYLSDAGWVVPEPHQKPEG